MIVDTEIMILQNLLQNKQYTARVLPYLRKEYFQAEKSVFFQELCNFVKLYKKIPVEDEFSVYVSERHAIPESVRERVLSYFPKIFRPVQGGQSLDFLVDTTESWCQDQAISLAVCKAVEILDGREKKLTKDVIPSMMKDALSISFNKSVGHEYLDVDTRFDWYQRKIEKIRYGIDVMDTIMNGGFMKKTLNLFIGGTHAGKSLCLCDLACKLLLRGKHVLFITLELSEEQVAQRMDANLLKVDVNDVPRMMESAFKNGIKNLSVKNNASLYIKEYPNGSVHTGHFRMLIEELDRKRAFFPDVVIVDYLNICASERMRDRSSIYTYYKSVAEELRALGQEKNVAVWSATQLNRTGFNSSDPGLGEVSDSFGVAMTADFAMVIYQDEAMKQMNQYMCKQEKNRYGDMGALPRFTIGVDKGQMRLYDVQQNLTI